MDNCAHGVETTISGCFLFFSSYLFHFWHFCCFASCRLQLVVHVCGGGLNVVEIVESLLFEWDTGFLFHEVFDSFDIIYSQYWLQEEGEVSFSKHLENMKQHYLGYGMAFARELGGLQLLVLEILF
jgi:hypothetical protein